MSERTVTFHGKSGRQYKYWIYATATAFKASPGNYAFAKDNGHTVTPVYFGQTDDLNRRLNFDNHNGKECSVRVGADVICAHTSGDKDTRCAEELDLVANYNPKCNL